MRKRKEIRDYYTWWEIYIAFIKKLLRIKSPSAFYISNGKYEYAYDFMTRYERLFDDSTCKTCKYYLLRSIEYPCARCRRNNALIDEIREQQNDRWKDGTPNGRK